MGVLFACGACGSPSVELPRAFVDSAGVHCKRCGLQLGTWGAFKEQAKKLILTELAARGQRTKAGAVAKFWRLRLVEPAGGICASEPEVADDPERPCGEAEA